VRRIAKVAVRMLGICALIYAAILAFLFFRQESLIFKPSKLPADHQYQLAGLSEVQIPVDGAVIFARHFKNPAPKGVLFFLHGNAGNLDGWITSVDLYRRTNYDLFMIDYRGYGKSGGQIESEAQLHADVRRAWDFIAPQYTGKSNVIFGRSLGTGLAAKLAADVQPAMTILVSPYVSMLAMRDEYYSFVPTALLRYPLRTDENLPRIKTPIVLVHGEQDELIPVSHTLRLHAIAPSADKLIVPGAKHGDLQLFPAYLNGLADKLGTL
jgi:hypothetical protein